MRKATFLLMSLLLCFAVGTQPAFAADWGLSASSLTTITANQTVVIKECPSTLTGWSQNSYMNSANSSVTSTIDYSCFYKFVENGTVTQGGTTHTVYVLYNLATGKYLAAENSYTANINDAYQLVASHAVTATPDQINASEDWSFYYNKTSLNVTGQAETLWVFCKKDGKSWLNVVGNPGVNSYHDTNMWLIYSVDESTALAAIKETTCSKVDELAPLTQVYGTIDTDALKASINAVTTTDSDFETANNNISSLFNAAFNANNKSIIFSNQAGASDVRSGLHITAGNVAGTDMAKAYGTSITDKNRIIWLIKENGNGTFKLYNAYYGLYLGTAASAGALSSEAANGADFTFVVRGTNKASIKDNQGNIFHQLNYWSPNYGYTNFNNDDAASNWSIESVEAATDELMASYRANMTRFLNIAYSYFQDKYGLVKTGDKIKIVINHSSGNDSQPSSNLLDGNTSTYVHSSYGDDKGTDPHYIQVELSEAQQHIMFYMAKRNDNDRPATIKVYVSEDGTNFSADPVATLENLHRLGDPYYSPAIDLGSSYKYLRFVVSSTNTNKIFFTASEFYVFPINPETESIRVHDVTEINSALIDAQNSFILQAELYGPKKEATAILTANASNHAETPELGQYTTVGYNALQAAVNDNNITLEDFNTAMDQFNRSQNRPVFIFTSAHDGGYCNNSSLYDDGSAWKWTTKNYYNKSMFTTVKDLTTTELTAGTAYNMYNYVTARPVFYDGTITPEAVAGKDGVFNLKVNTGYHYLHCQNNGNSLVTWYACAPNSEGTAYNNLASSWRIEYVGNSYDFDQIKDFPITCNDLLSFTSACTEANFGSGLGQYSGVDYNQVATSVAAITALQTRENTTRYSVTNTEIVNALAAYEIAVAGATLNQPTVGKFYRFKNLASNKYLTSTLANSKMTLQAAAAGGINTLESVFYLAEGNKLVSYENGLFTKNFTSSNYGFEAAGAAGNAITFAQGNPITSATSCYHLTCGTRALYGNSTQTVDEVTYTTVDGGNNITPDNTDAGYDWAIEEVSYLPIAVNSTVKYGTIYAPVDLKLRNGLEAFTGTINNGEWLHLNPVTSVIPAGTAVVLKDTGAERDETTNCIYLQITSGADAISENALAGTYTTIGKVTNAYTLQNQESGIGFYPYSGTTMAGFKAYLPMGGGVRGFLFQEGETTLIEGIENNVELNQPVYDLSGRRVLNAQKGIYIIGGKKVILK